MLSVIIRFNLGKTFQIQLAVKFSANSVKCFNRSFPFAQSKQNAPSTTKLSLATRNREIAIHIQSTASRDRAIAADIRATHIYIRAAATRSREIGIYSREIASCIREIAADSQEVTANIEEIAGDTRRIAAPGSATIARCRFRPIYGQNPLFFLYAPCRRLNTVRP